MIFFTADHHFGHGAVIEYSSRPFATVELMNAALIAGWRAVVNSTDTVYVVGDFSFQSARDMEQTFHQLPGQKILIRGNHDSKYVRKLFKTVLLEAVLEIAKTPVRLSHYPYRGDHTGEERFLERRPPDDGKWLIHGHVHNAWKQDGKQICVSVENWDYKPVPITTIEVIIQKGVA